MGLTRTGRAPAVIGVLVVAAGLPACSVTGLRDGDRPAQVATPVRAGCPRSAAEFPGADGAGGLIGSGRAPDGFEPARILRCTWDTIYVDEAATRARVTVREQEAASDPAGIVESLQLPDQEFGLFASTACPAIYTPPDFLILVDANGKAVLPHVPQTSCDETRAETKKAIDDMRWLHRATVTFETSRVPPP